MKIIMDNMLFAGCCIGLIYVLKKITDLLLIPQNVFFKNIALVGFVILYFRFFIHYYNMIHDYLWKWSNHISMGETIIWIAGLVVIFIISIICAEKTVNY